MKQKTRLSGGFFEIREKIEEKLCDRAAELLWSAQAGRACDEESEFSFAKPLPMGEICKRCGAHLQASPRRGRWHDLPRRRGSKQKERKTTILMEI